MNKIIEDIIGISIVTAGVAIMLFLLVYIGVSIDAREECHAAGWIDQNVDISLTRYCTSRIDGSDIIVPFDEAIENGNQSNLYIREVFKQYGAGNITEASK